MTGPLFATDAMRAVFSDENRLAAMLAVESALAQAEAELGLVPEEAARAIAAIAPASLDAEAIGRATALAGVPTIPFVQAVQAQLPPASERFFHKGATTQDILDTALVLQMRDALALIRAELRPILAGLATLAQTHRETPCAGRTYGQHAAPITFGYKAAVWLGGIAEVAARLPTVESSVLTVSLSGPVGTLASLGADGPAVMQTTARILHLGAPAIAWHARRARIAEMGCWLAQLTGALAKMATDIASLCTTEIAEVAEPFVPGRGGSSAMPHKRNPVSCTVILAAHAASPGLAATLIAAMAASHERPAGAWHSEWHALPSLFGLASGALHEARALAEGLEVDPARMRQNLDLTHGMLFADAAAARLAAKLGREAAHHLVERASDAVRASGESLQAVLARDPAVLASGVDIGPAFDLAPAIAASGVWVDRAVAEASRSVELMQGS